MKNAEPLPERISYIVLLDRMKCNYLEFLKMPRRVISDYILFMNAESMLAKDIESRSRR